jgi:hypothetical protein
MRFLPNPKKSVSSAFHCAAFRQEIAGQARNDKSFKPAMTGAFAFPLPCGEGVGGEVNSLKNDKM